MYHCIREGVPKNVLNLRQVCQILGDNQPGTEHLSKNREHIYNLSKSELDWRDLLKDYVKKLDPDYSFNPPDRRMDSLDVYLPSFTEDEEEPKNILFMIDTSASIQVL